MIDIQTHASMSSSSDHHENYSKRVSPKMVLQGPRPPPLKVIKDSSCIIKKPAVLATNIDHDSHPHDHQLMISTGTRRCNLDQQRRRLHRRPKVIHLKSPKVIHTRPQDFMVLVQQLTGKQSTSSVLPLLVSSSTTSGSISSSTHKCGGSSSSSSDPTNLIVDHHVHDEDNYKEIITNNKDIKEEDHHQYNLLHHQLSCDSGISSLRTSNILSPAYNSLFGTTPGFMSSPNAACTNLNWHDFGSILR